MATLFDFCRVMSQPVNWYHDMTCHGHMSMWAGHVSSVGFAILCSQHWILQLILVNLNASTVAFIEIWENCPCSVYIFTNTTLNRLGFGMLTAGTAIFHWLYFVPYFDCICWFLSGRILFGTGGKVLWSQDPLEWAWTKQRQRKYCLLYSSGEMFKSVPRNLFTINEHPIANVSLHLCFQLRTMYGKKYTFTY